MHPLLLTALTRRGGVFTTADAVAVGHTRHGIAALVRGGRWRTVRYGVHTTDELWRQHAAAGRGHGLEAAAVLARLGRSTTVLSHVTAARLHDLVLPGGVGHQVTATDPRRFRTGRDYRVLAAGLPSGDVETFPPLPVTTLRRTLLDVGREWDVTDAVIALDDALADGRITVEELTAGVLTQAHWVGVGALAGAVRLARVGAHSPLETRARLGLLAGGLPEPVLQAAVLRDERLVAVLDLWFPGTPAFGEVDGRVKWTDPWRGRSPSEVGWDEKRRHDELVDLGLVGTRIAAADLGPGLTAKAERIRSLLAAPLELPAGVRIVPWRAGLRREPRSRPWSTPFLERSLGVV
ncbi:hypothetical protein SAMN05660199_02743 [Klenkia soli]|uniref:Transcriptional regulator, AbiEi antitoxin, Type IV TA system n=1 Tax=Klenkia soli TaxID=1052260 RepID=A0A1H0N4Z8_9ACTN|nr:hypothetical protein [Klenkia soli]SDO87701.1 hypothetical protein SAMN05660199_02743 [Klenkia soli]